MKHGENTVLPGRLFFVRGSNRETIGKKLKYQSFKNSFLLLVSWTQHTINRKWLTELIQNMYVWKTNSTGKFETIIQVDTNPTDYLEEI